MQIADSRIVLTGACGGIGGHLSRLLADRGACLGLVDRNAEALESLAQVLTARGTTVKTIVADITDPASHERVRADMQSACGGIDMLINQAGTMAFGPLPELDPLALQRVMAVNVIAPIMLTRALLPAMLEQGSGRIVNIGSTFGTLGFPLFTAYSASKFALRGFSEALRRELAGTGIGVTHVSPRGVKTPFNPAALYRIAERTGMNMDEPAAVAGAILRAVECDRKDVYLGFPESLFARINGIAPRLIDRGLRKQTAIMHTEYTRQKVEDESSAG